MRNSALLKFGCFTTPAGPDGLAGSIGSRLSIAACFCYGLWSMMPAPVGLAACRLEKYAELPVVMNGRHPTIEGSINGIPAAFVADSGAFYSVLWADRVGRFGLRLERAAGGLQLQGVGGREEASVGTVKDFTLRGLGGNVLHNVQFLVAGHANTPSDGNIGQNILGRADTEYDLGNGVIRLFRSSGCDDYSLAYWRDSAPVSEMRIRLTSNWDSQIIGSAKLNGTEISVGFDSGSTNSMLALRAAVRAGFDPSKATSNNTGNFAPIGTKESEIWVTHFDDLDLGGENIKHVRLMVADAAIPGSFDLILGVDFFLSHRIYIAQSQHKVYFTYNGGHVFDVGEPSGNLAVRDSTPIPAQKVPAGSAEQAGQYMRRGAASAARADFPRAIADFDAAIAMNPGDAENYSRRGSAKAKNHQLSEALTDYDQALKLQPGSARWLRIRGVLHLALNDDTAAAADFDQAARLPSANDNADLEIAEIYNVNGRFEQAVDRVGRWIDSHPRDAGLAEALNSRCWFRAEWGRELDKALADCDASLKMKPRSAEALDSRALVYLRLGDYEKSASEYKSALRRNPKQAASLFGLGLAQVHSGNQVEGIKHMHEALAIDSDTAERYRSIGLTP